MILKNKNEIKKYKVVKGTLSNKLKGYIKDYIYRGYHKDDQLLLLL
jgi:hypothetical protein